LYMLQSVSHNASCATISMFQMVLSCKPSRKYHQTWRTDRPWLLTARCVAEDCVAGCVQQVHLAVVLDLIQVPVRCVVGGRQRDLCLVPSNLLL
jgi:hypothetical protein